MWVAKNIFFHRTPLVAASVNLSTAAAIFRRVLKILRIANFKRIFCGPSEKIIEIKMIEKGRAFQLRIYIISLLLFALFIFSCIAIHKSLRNLFLLKFLGFYSPTTYPPIHRLTIIKIVKIEDQVLSMFCVIENFHNYFWLLDLPGPWSPSLFCGPRPSFYDCVKNISVKLNQVNWFTFSLPLQIHCFKTGLMSMEKIRSVSPNLQRYHDLAENDFIF